METRGGQQQQGVGSHLQSGQRLTGVGMMNLGLTDAEQSFLIAKIHFDVPAAEVLLHDLLGWQRGIGAEEKGRIAITDT